VITDRLAHGVGDSRQKTDLFQFRDAKDESTLIRDLSPDLFVVRSRGLRPGLYAIARSARFLPVRP
jgi:hypothetical protein